MPLHSPLPEIPGVKYVDSFDALAQTPFRDGINALCWPRTLPAGFAEIVRLLGPGEGVRNLDADELQALREKGAPSEAIDLLLEDLRLLRALERDPVLNCIHAYPRDEGSPVPTDVYSFHADSAPVEADTWLCTYHGAPSEGIPNEDAIKIVERPEVRSKLLALFGVEDDSEFESLLREHCYDLHYAPRSESRIYSFGLGNVWRIAVQWPGSLVAPCVHRAPLQTAGDSARLLAIC